MIKQDYFNNWVARKMSIYEYRRLSLNAKTDMFFTWKYGFSSRDINEAIDQSQRWIVSRLTNISPEHWANMKPKIRVFFQDKIKWMDWCDKQMANLESVL